MFPSKVSVHTHIKRFYHRGVVDEMALHGFSLGILTSSCSLKRSILGNWLFSFGCMNGCLRLCVSPMTNLWLAQCTLRLAPWKLEKGSSSPWKKMFELDLQVLVYTSWCNSSLHVHWCKCSLGCNASKGLVRAGKFVEMYGWKNKLIFNMA